MRARTVLIGAVLAWPAVPLHAQGGPDTGRFSRAWQNCITYGERNNALAIPATVCNGRELRVQDARLNQAYRMVMARLPPQRRADLRADERNWIVARDGRCLPLGAEERGECLIDATIRRVRYLERVR